MFMSFRAVAAMSRRSRYMPTMRMTAHSRACRTDGTWNRSLTRMTLAPRRRSDGSSSNAMNSRIIDSDSRKCDTSGVLPR